MQNINILQTVQWANFNWELSFETKVHLKSLLPVVNNSYALQFQEYEVPSLTEKANILWLPPHSELNGLYDKRPSEFLNAYVIQGTLGEINESKRSMGLFTVEKCTSMLEAITSVAPTIKSPLIMSGRTDGSSCLFFEQCSNTIMAKFDKYIYLHGSCYEASCEVVLAKVDGNFHIVFSAYTPPCSYEAIITNYRLSQVESVIISRILDCSECIEDNSYLTLDPGQVIGAEYW